MQNGEMESPDSKDQPHGLEAAAKEEESNSQTQTTQTPHHHYQQRWRPPPPQQPWMAMHQYHPAAVVMHQQQQQQLSAAGVLPRHYYGMQFVGYPHNHPHQGGSNQQGVGPGQSQRGSRHKGFNNAESNRTIWVGDLHPWMDENYLHSCFVSSGEIASIKVIRNKHTGLSEGYGFVEFFSHAMAEKVLQNYTGTVMPYAEQPFRLNWASFSTVDKHPENGSDLSIFVGDLAADVTDSLLHETFASKYTSVKAAKVVFDVNTGRSKGNGFVRFGDDCDRSQAMTEMNGAYCLGRPMRIGAATPRKTSLYPQQYSPQGSYLLNRSPARGLQSDGESANTTIFIGGLDPDASDEDLRQPFSQYGEIVSVKIPANKGCGFIQFANRSDAEEALQKLNGTAIGKQTVRLFWGHNPAMKQFRADLGKTNGVQCTTEDKFTKEVMDTVCRQPMTRACTPLPALPTRPTPPCMAATNNKSVDFGKKPFSLQLGLSMIHPLMEQNFAERLILCLVGDLEFGRIGRSHRLREFPDVFYEISAGAWWSYRTDLQKLMVMAAEIQIQPTRS